MGPDEHISREEFLLTVDHLMAVIDHQQKISKLLLEVLSDSSTLNAPQIDYLSDELAASPEHQRRIETFERLASFEEIRNVIERYRDRPPEGD
jgi:hypothetical protein